MKKMTLIKLLLVVAAAVALYGQPVPKKTSPLCEPGGLCLMGRVTCGDNRIAHCVDGQCVCP
jgi:hypothetical protein